MSGSEDGPDWQFVSQPPDQDKDSVDDTQSEGSIEVVSIEGDDLEDQMMEQPGSQQPPPTTKPYFILRVLSSEQDLTTESDSSDESDGNDFRVIRQRKTTLTRNDHKEGSINRSSSPSLSSLSPATSREATPEHFDERSDGVNLAVMETESTCSNDLTPSLEDEELSSQHDFEMIHIEDHLSCESVNVDDAVEQIPETDDSHNVEVMEHGIVQHDVQREENLPAAGTVQVEENVIAAEVMVQEHNVPVMQHEAQREENVPAAVAVLREENVPAAVAVPGEENVAAVVDQGEGDAPAPVAVQNEEENEGGMEDEQFELLGPNDGLDTESAAEMEDEDDRIESDQSTDHSSQHSDDNSNVSNLDIGDLMADPSRIRQYIHQPNSHLNVTLNTICVLVLAVAIGLGIGHAIGSKRERLMQRRMWQDNFGNVPKVPTNKPMTDSPILEKSLAEKLVLMTEKEKKLEENIKHLLWKLKENEAIRLKYSELQKECQDVYVKYSMKEREVLEFETLQNENAVLNETVVELQNELKEMKEEKASARRGLSEGEERDLRDEVARLTSDNNLHSALLEEQQKNAKNLEEILAKIDASHKSQLRMKEKSWKNIVNMLEMEKQDLVKEIGNLRYSLHPGNDATENQAQYKERVNQLETEKSDLIRQVGSMRYSPYPGNKAGNSGGEGGSETESGVEDDADVRGEDDEDYVDVQSDGDEDVQSPVKGPCQEQLQDLSRKLEVEQQRSDMWQRLYMTVQREHKQTRTDNSSRDFFGCVTYLLRNVTVPQNLSKMLKEKVDLSLDALKYLYNVFKGETTTECSEGMNRQNNPDEDSHGNLKGRKYEKQQSRSSNDDKQSRHSKRGRPTWKETMEEVLNKTKSSVSDVSKQIQDTWQQVKNLSKDLWKKHEPALEKFQKEMSEKVDKFTAHVQKKFKETTGRWFKKEGKFKKNRKREDDHDEFVEKGYKFRASTSRRDYDDDDGDDRKVRRNHATPTFHSNENGQDRKQSSRKLEKLRKRVSRIRRKKFCKMDFEDRESMFDALDKVDDMVSEDSWQSCQWDWWWNAISHHLHSVIIIQPECSRWLQAWQIDISDTGDWLCRYKDNKVQSGHDSRSHHHGSGKKCGKNKAHIEKRFRHHQKHPRLDGKAHKKHSYKHNHKHSDRHHPTRSSSHHDKDSMENRPTLAEDSQIPNATVSAYFGCDPYDEECNKESFSWYIQQMHHRDQQRLSEEIQTERAKWLLSRGRAREELRHREEEEERRASWQFKQAKLREKSRSEDQSRHDEDEDDDDVIVEDIYYEDEQAAHKENLNPFFFDDSDTHLDF